MILANHGIVSSSGGILDDAQAFIAAANITDNTQKSAITTLVTDLKAYNIWDKMKAIYPFVGGSATSHKFNLKDPRDLDAAFRLTFNGGWTHSSTGALPNGTTGYADTNFTGTLLQQNSGHLSIYLRSNINSLTCDIGLDDNTGSSSIWARNNNLVYSQINNGLGSFQTINNTGSIGLFLVSRTASNVLTSYINQGYGVATNPSTSPSTKKIYLGALNDLSGIPLFYSSRQQAFASIGDGLTNAEAANFYNAVQLFNTTLNRNV